MRLFDSSILYWNNQLNAYDKAECYRTGRLVKHSLPRALALYREAARLNDARGYFRLGEFFEKNGQRQQSFTAFYAAGIRGHDETLSHLHSLANTDAEAAITVARIHENLRQSLEAIRFYKKAHQLKHPDGMYHVAKLFDVLSSSEKQGKEVSDFYRESVKLGSKYALDALITLSESSGKAAFYVAQLYEMDLKQMDRALSFYEKASQLRYGEATYTLGNRYAHGKANIAVDTARAIRYYVTAIHQHDSAALSSLQVLAQSRNTQAQFALAEYYRGAKKEEDALRWFIQAALQDHAPAKQYLKTDLTADQHWTVADLYLEYSMTQEDEQWRYHCQKAADKGNAHAAFYLAQQSEGRDCNRQRSSIVTRYGTAARSGHKESEAATERLSRELIYSSGNPATVFVRATGNVSSYAFVQQKMRRR